MNKSLDSRFLSINQLYQNSDEYQQGINFTEWIHELKQEFSELNSSPRTRQKWIL
ncbi:MAG: hypothetical protein HC892_01600 [Saprospiraceae bacterium]|nr:hypothetical protein [Saprospiraceae bacterium]